MNALVLTGRIGRRPESMKLGHFHNAANGCQNTQCHEKTENKFEPKTDLEFVDDEDRIQCN